ncbi:hypothetical protein [Flavobacterium sp. N502540]|uniref:hypothetical protein n=1 Tax=Flavobacterium sp. N502540 TaxID=2986838 RepID=UPI0022258FBA|nr:hypothetical protein [Flavobacterium sp. N502540]
MKKLIYLFIIGQLLISCNDNLQKKSKLEIKPNTKSDNSGKINLQTAQVIYKDSLDISFIGRTTKELNKYNFHICFGAMIEEYSENEKYAVSEYSLKVGNCRNGKSKITIEQFINYYDEVKANFVIKDELIVRSSYPKKCYSTITLKLENREESKYLMEYEDNSKAILTNIHKLWEINLNEMKFIEIETPKNFKCNNPGFADGI